MNTLLITNSIEKSRNYICQQLQTAWDTERINDNRKKTKEFLKESDYFKIIDSTEKYNAFDINFIPEIIFIVPELNWSNDDVNEGYDIARELITKKYKSDFIQIVFLSVLERATLKDMSDVRNKSFVEAFPHVCILDDKVNLQFKYYSEIHFKLIKHLAISDEGRLQRISHEMNSVKTNISRETRDVVYNRTELIAKLEELTLFQQWSGIKITDEIEKANNATVNFQLAYISKTTENIIDEIYLKLSPKGVSNKITTRDKTNYKVFIIEDDKEYRKFFSETFSRFYTEVYPDKNDSFPVNKTTKDFNISEAEDIIKTIGKSFNIFLLDLLYKDDAGNWLNFNGLDLYRLVKSVNPYAVRRIITSLPRGIVAKLAEVITSDTEKPNIDQVYTKKYGFDYLKDTVIESIEKINEECKAKEKSKSVWAPFPKEGLFKWEGISDDILELIKSEESEFKDNVKKAVELFKLYETGQLILTQQGWDQGKLPNTRKEGDYANKIRGKLRNILTHRLIVLNEALKNADCKIYYYEYKEILDKICNLSPGTNYFFTKLGFRVNRYDIEADKTTHWYKINLINLFPHEYDFVFNIQRKNNLIDENNLLRDNYPNLNNFFLNVLTDTSIYDVWEVLELDFNPYTQDIITKIETGEVIEVNEFSGDVKLKNARDFFQSLIKNYSDKFISQIVDKVTTYILDRHVAFESEFEDTFTNNLINSLINKEIESTI